MKTMFDSMTGEPELVIIHVSDLHLHGELSDSGRRLSGLQYGIRTHRYFTLQAAAEAIRRIAVENYGQPVALFATGDLSTAGEPSALHLARSILTADEVQSGGRTLPVGLNHGWPLFLVPGNHDRYSSTIIAWQQSAFESEFSDLLPRDNWERYGLTRPTTDIEVYPRLPYAYALQCTGGDGASLDVVVVGLDSTDLTSAERLNPWFYIAQGRVRDEALSYVRRVAHDVLERRVLVDSTGATIQLHSERPRILLLLHHHPHLPPDQHRNPSTKLRNATDVMDTCAAARIDSVFFGHEHIAFVDEVTLRSNTDAPRRALCAAAGSISIFDESNGNSFAVYQVTRREIRCTTWYYGKGIFRPGSSREIVLPD